jgi:RNA-binding protein YlmH
MTKTELLNKTARSEEERLLLARVLDKLELARSRSVPSYTGFLSPGERELVEALLNAAGHPRRLFFGGWVEAERTVCAFLPDWQDEDDWAAGDCPVSALRASFPAGAGLTHRDFLGAILGLGITREKIGDLLVDNGRCDIIILKEIEDFLLLHLDGAGRMRLKLTPIALDALAPCAAEVKRIRDTVATLRLDAVAASAFSLPRSKAHDLIASGRLHLNHRECTKPDRAVVQGDVITCRGLGKCVVTLAGGLSKKGRIMIELERYL